MIICCGDALIDMLPRTLADGGEALLPTNGGAVFNVAVALGRLGISTGFFAGLSTDRFGRRLQAALDKAGVDSALCVRSDRPTTLAFVDFDEGEARYTFYDEGTASRMLTEAELPELPAEAAALHFGAISLATEPCGSAFEALLVRESGRRLISLDPNIRISFIADPETHRARIRRLVAHSDIVKVSDQDLAWIEPDAPAETAIESWIAAGTSMVLLTSGPEGATAYSAGGRVSVAPAPVAVADTVGAGDGFVAGFLAGLDDKGVLSKPALGSIDADTVRHCLALASHVAGIVVSRHGADPPWRAELG